MFMKLKKYLPYLIIPFSFSPKIAFAQSNNCGRSFKNFTECILSFLTDLIIPILFSVAIIVFVYGIVKYVIAGANSNNRREATNTMIWGILGLFVMFAVWGIVALISNTTGIGLGGQIPIPQFSQ